MQDDHRAAPPESAQSDGTPGWDAINQAMTALYPGQEPRHFGTLRPLTLGGDDPLDGISVYWTETPRPHWHFVTFGFSELYDKQSDDPDHSGFGFELTFRLAAPLGASADSPPPMWPLNLLQNLARYVFESGNVFEQGHYLNANGPIALEHDTRLRHLAFMRDPQLAPRQTPHGRLELLQTIGLADGEMDAILTWSAEAVLHALAPAMPLWITDLDRGDLMDDPALAGQIQHGSQREGSSTAALFVDDLDWQVTGQGPARLVIGAGQVARLQRLLPARLPYGRSLELAGRQRSWVFEPGRVDRVQCDGATAVCTLVTASLAQLLQQLRPQRGTYPLGDGDALVIEVRPTTLRDTRGEPAAIVG